MNARIRELTSAARQSGSRPGSIDLVIVPESSEVSNSFVFHFDSYALLAHFLAEAHRRSLSTAKRRPRAIARILSIDGVTL